MERWSHQIDRLSAYIQHPDAQHIVRAGQRKSEIAEKMGLYMWMAAASWNNSYRKELGLGEVA